MNNEKIFNKSRLNSLMKKLENDASDKFSAVSRKDVIDFEQELLRILRVSLDIPEWALEHFLSLALGFYVLDDLQKIRYITNPSDLFYQSQLKEWVIFFVQDKKKINLKNTKGKAIFLVGEDDSMYREAYFFVGGKQVFVNGNYTPSINLKSGCGLYLMTKLPATVNQDEEFRNSYICLSEESDEGKKFGEFSYIDNNGVSEVVVIADTIKFGEKLKKYMGEAEYKHLSSVEIGDLITSNGGHAPDEEYNLGGNRDGKIKKNFKNKVLVNNIIERSLSKNGFIRERGAMRPVCTFDIHKIQEETNLHFTEKLKILKDAADRNDLDTATSPMIWLELTESINIRINIILPDGKPGGTTTLVNQRMATLIQCAHFKLNLSEEEFNSITSPKDIVNLAINNSLDEPEIYTYAQLKNWLRKNPVNQIYLYCINNYLPAYLGVAEKYVVTSHNKGSRTIYKNASPNPAYPRRYAGLERLMIDGVPYGFDLRHLLKEDKYLDLNKNSGSHLFNEFQPTDLEEKFHVVRTLCPFKKGEKSFNSESIIKPKHLVFLGEDLRGLGILPLPSAAFSVESVSDDGEVKDKISMAIQTQKVEQPQINYATNSEELLLTRKAIKNTYNKISGRGWEGHFSRDEFFAKIKIQGKTKPKDSFPQGDVNKWLIQNGYYTPEEIKKIMPQESKKANIDPMLHMAKISFPDAFK